MFIQRFTSDVCRISPANPTYLIGSKYLSFRSSLSNERNTDGKQCRISICSMSSQSARRHPSRRMLLLSGAHTTPPEHNGTNTSFKNPSNDGDANWLTLVPAVTPSV